MDKKLPNIVMGVLALISGFAVFLLPETRGTTLPDTIAEIEVQAKGHDSKQTDAEGDNMIAMS